LAHIFLSYASEDRVRAREIAADLEALGWAVWWDHKLQAGKTFAGVIESEIKKSDCVLVLWSKASITSRWVRDEANEGLERGILVPVLIDAVEPPMGFRSIHAANLIGYDGDQSSPGFRQLVSDLRALLTPGAPAPVQRRTAIHTHRGGTGVDWRAWLLRLGLAALGVAIVAVGTFGVMRYFDNFDHRAAELESRQKAFDEARRRTEEEAAKRQAELDAKQRSLDEKARATAAEAARRAEEEDKRREDQRREDQRREDQRKEDQRRTAQADAERARAAAEAARKAEEAKQKQALKTPPKPVAPPAPAPQAALAPAAPAAPAPAPAAEAPKPPAAEPVAPKVAVAARSPLLPSPSDTWSYRYVDGFRRAEVARLTYRVDAVSETGVGELLRVSNRPDYQSRIVVARVPSFAGHPGLDYAPPDLAPYLQAFYRLDDGAPLPTVKRQFSSDATVEMSMRIVGREQVTVPAGTFNAIKVVAEGRGSTFINRFPIHSIVTIWYAPEAKRFVKFDARTYERNMPQELAVFELVDYKLAR
jgi:Skp family chaperone for outer membrane proteins